MCLNAACTCSTELRDNGIAGAPQTAKYLAGFLDWDRAHIQKELRAYQDNVDAMIAFKK